ncbi:MAG: hypothetical protein IKJ45_17440 [Kiritimatiellae bacterium]|nr:hypothetical protein [Kiritimatiellia bacterium]
MAIMAFSRIMHSINNLASWKRGKELEARRDEARQKSQSAKQVKPRREYDIISRMTKTAKNAILMAAPRVQAWRN